MRLRPAFVGLAVLAALTAPAPAGEFDKYVPDNAQFYAHVRLPKFFESDLVRKAVPLAFDKYGDTLAMFAGMAKQFDANAPEIPEEQVKEGMKQLSDPKRIAQFFDIAKDVVTDVVIIGNDGGGGMPDVVALVKCQLITNEAAEMFVNAAGAAPQFQVERIKKDKGTVYAVSVPQAQGMKVYLSVPEAGVLHMTMSEKKAEAAFAAKGKPGAGLSSVINKAGPSDFLFVAGAGGDNQDYTSMSANVTLDKDLGGKVNVAYKDEATAAAKAKEMNERFAEMATKIQDSLGDKAAALKPHVEKSKANVNGKTVNATFSLPGSAVESMLKKD